ncbi:MAG: glycosyltransferase family 4 protein [Rhodothermaceae bacterium]|nr:glycosyltransferase family 4 protein [Rhodothermaceae bacterium]MYF64342.1 glycosyltransferase family 4 protein [Rhodothermaceae bacterium]
MKQALPSPSELRTVHVIGRYPPPIDGQSLATQSLASLLVQDHDVKQFNMTLTDRALLSSGYSGARQTIQHYLKLKPKLKSRLSDGNPVLWANISSQPSGHWRDLMTVVPCLYPKQPVVAVVHWGNFSRIFKHWSMAASARKLVRRLDRVVVLSRELANQIEAYVPARKLCVIPNYVPQIASDDDFRIKHANNAASSTIRVLFLSHMIKEKGCYDLLQAIAIATNQGLSLEVHFAGRWNVESDEGKFRSEVERLGLKDTVVIHGPISDRRAVAKLHQTADVFALPSLLAHEAQPLAIMEALSAGTPVIVTKLPVLEALVNEEQGASLVPPRNPEAIANALISLSSREVWQKKSFAARTHYKSEYSPETVRQAWTALIKNL